MRVYVSADIEGVAGITAFLVEKGYDGVGVGKKERKPAMAARALADLDAWLGRPAASGDKAAAE